MLLEDEEVMYFNKNYKDVIDSAYKRVPYSEDGIKICPYYNLVLKEKDNGGLYCISEKCSRKTKGFLNVESIKLSEEVLVLKSSVAYSIYYFGLLDQDIKGLLGKYKLKYKLWPDFDRYDFEVSINNEKWAIDAKYAKNYQYIIDDINEMNIFTNDYHRVFYVVPNDRPEHYLKAINKNIRDSKYKCITLNELKKIIKNGGVI